MSTDPEFFYGMVSGLLAGCFVGYLVGLRAGIRKGRPSWEEKEAREASAWHDGVRFGQHLEHCKKELGL